MQFWCSASWRGLCYLKGEAALAERVESHPFVVSGDRRCGAFGEGLAPDVARARTGLAAPPWRTAPTPLAGPGPRTGRQHNPLSERGL